MYFVCDVVFTPWGSVLVLVVAVVTVVPSATAVADMSSSRCSC